MTCPDFKKKKKPHCWWKKIFKTHTCTTGCCVFTVLLRPGVHGTQFLSTCSQFQFVLSYVFLHFTGFNNMHIKHQVDTQWKHIFLISLSICPLRPCENIIKLANQRGCINIYCRLTTAINILEPSTSSENMNFMHQWRSMKTCFQMHRTGTKQVIQFIWWRSTVMQHFIEAQAIVTLVLSKRSQTSVACQPLSCTGLYLLAPC